MLDIGIIGLGGWGRRLVESVQGKSDLVRFTAAVTGTPAKAADFATKHGITVGGDLDAMLADPSIKAVVSTATVGLHAAHSLAAIEAGKPVLAVKPMAVKRADAEALAAAAEKHGVLLALGYNRCFLPAVDAMREHIAAGDLGLLLHIEGNFCVDRYGKLKEGDWKTDPSQVIAGALADHMLYMAIEMMGPIADVHVQASQRAISVPIADTTAVLLRFASGASGLLTAIGATADYERLTIFGSTAWAEMRDMSHFEFKPTSGDGKVMDFPKFDAERAELEAFADAVTGAKAFPVPVVDAVNGVAAIEAMGKSATSGKPVIL